MAKTILTLNDASPMYTIPANDNAYIIGTNNANKLAVAIGADVEFDPSFTKGGDTIYFQGKASDFTVKQAFGTVTFTYTDGHIVTIPAGTANSLVFADGDAQLKTDANGKILFGTQEVTATATKITSTLGSTTSGSVFGGGVNPDPDDYTISCDSSISESGTLTVTVKADTVATADTELMYVLSGTGTNPAEAKDFTSATSGKITIPKGSDKITFDIKFNSGDDAEFAEDFKIEVKDSSNSIVGTKSVTILDSSTEDKVGPVFTSSATAVYNENKTVSDVLLDVDATDASGVASYAITGGNDSKFFQIDAATGKITLTADGAKAGAASNDAETAPNSFALEVTATDTKGNATKQAVTLEVKDLDDTPPVIKTATLGGTAITLTFDENLDAASIPAGSSFTVLQNGNTSVAVNTVTVNGSAVTLGLASAPTGTVTVSYTPPATTPLQDKDSNDVVAISAMNVETDTTKPTLASSNPADGATDVDVAANIVITFSETIQAGTGDIKIVSSDGSDNRTISVTDAQVTISGNTLTINPTADLSTALDYSIQMASGVIKDTSGNAFDGLTSATMLNFTTKQPVMERLTSGSDIKSANVFDGTLDILSGQSVETLTSGDRLTGTGTNPTLNLQVQEYVHTVTPLKMTGIQTVKIDTTTLLPTGQAAGAPSLDLVNADTSIQNLSLNGQTQAFTLVNIPNIISAVSVVNNAGGSVAAGNDVTATFQNSVLGGNSDAITINLNQVTTNGNAAPAAADITFQPSAAGVSGFETFNVVSGGSIINTINSLTDGNGNSLTTVNVSGSQMLVIATALDNTVSTINAAASTGGVNVTVGAASANVAATGGSGNDTFNYDATYTTGDVINGGTGTDTLRLSSVQAVVTTAQSNVTNVETIRVGDAHTGALNLTHFGAVNALLDTTAAITAVLAAASTITYTAGTGGLTINNDDTGANTLGVTISGSATTDILNVNLQNADLGAALTITGAETVNLVSTNGTLGTAADGSANTATAITLTDTAAAEVLNISGDVALTLTGAFTANTINAGSFTGVLTMAAATVSTGGATITGGSGGDTLFGSGVNDIISGGAGADRIIGSGNQGLLVPNQADLLTGGTGADTFVFYDTLGGAATVSNATNVNLTQITDFVAGTDKIALMTGVPATSVNLNTAQTISTAANAAGVIAGMTAVAASAPAGALQAVVVTVSGGAAAGTYLYVNDSTGALNATNDLLINITGVTGTITSSDFVFA